MKVRFLIEKVIQEVVEITKEEFESLKTMNDEEKEYFFYEKALFFKDERASIFYNEVI